jgi:hypothetical protein
MQTQILALTFSLIKSTLIWDQKVQCHISDSLLPTYLYVYAQLCVCIIKKCPMSYRLFFLCRCPPLYLHHYTLPHTRDEPTSQIWEQKKVQCYISNTLSPTTFLSRCPLECLHIITCFDTPEMGKAAKYWRKKVPCHISDTLPPTYFLVSVPTCVFASLHAATH